MLTLNNLETVQMSITKNLGWVQEFENFKKFEHF